MVDPVIHRRLSVTQPSITIYHHLTICYSTSNAYKYMGTLNSLKNPINSAIELLILVFKLCGVSFMVKSSAVEIL